MCKQKLITRPELASILMQRGYEAIVGKNPYKPNLTAWTFSLDEAGDQIVKAFYDRLKGGDPK